MKAHNLRRRRAHRYVRRLQKHQAQVTVPWSVVYRLQGMTPRGYRY